MSKSLQIESLSEELAERLELESKSRGESPEAVAVQILESALDSSAPKRRDLSRFVDWTQDDVDRVDRALAAQRTIDENHWR